MLTAYEQMFHDAFSELGTERAFGMAPGPIPRRAIIAFADDARMDDDQTIILLRVIRAMDAAYLTALAEKREDDIKPK